MDIQAKINLLANSTNNVKALASITIENCFVVTGIKVILGQNGEFISMPQRKTAGGEYKDICFPITAEARAAIQDVILKAYYEKLDNNAAENQNEFNNYSSNFDDLPF